MVDDLPTVRAEDFWGRFQANLLSERPSGFGGEWTRGMYQVLHAVQRDLNLWCQCKPGHETPQGAKGELLKIDMMWFKQGVSRWAPPLVAIEHENAWNLDESRTDFWRVAQICAPLRICIVYVRTADRVENTANALISTAVENEWQRLPDAEDLLVLGHGNMGWDGFRAWRLDAAGTTELTTTQTRPPNC